MNAQNKQKKEQDRNITYHQKQVIDCSHSFSCCWWMSSSSALPIQTSSSSENWCQTC